ncbi:MAG: hypothetical protein ABSE71_04075 [Candidatus Micrarchaeaceae archaeon]|jgi:hypothetical protein
MVEKREKFYTVSERLVFSGAMVVLITALIFGTSVALNKGPVPPLGIAGVGAPGWNITSTATTSIIGSSSYNQLSPVVNTICFGSFDYSCQNPVFNYTTGILTVAISQKSGYNWTSVTVRFVPSNDVYSHGVPELSWSPPQAVNVTGGMLNNTMRYVDIPITSGPIAAGTNITGSIWAKYQLNVGGGVSYANMSSATITVES